MSSSKLWKETFFIFLRINWPSGKIYKPKRSQEGPLGDTTSQKLLICNTVTNPLRSVFKIWLKPLKDNSFLASVVGSKAALTDGCHLSSWWEPSLSDVLKPKTFLIIIKTIVQLVAWLWVFPSNFLSERFHQTRQQISLNLLFFLLHLVALKSTYLFSSGPFKPCLNWYRGKTKWFPFNKFRLRSL